MKKEHQLTNITASEVELFIVGKPLAVDEA
jgi:hypothetical protein